MSQKHIRIARPGDIFILLVPSAQELHHIQQRQMELHARYGGRVVPNPHITCQRFSPLPGNSKVDCLGHLVEELADIQSFQIFTDRLIQFYAPYWDSQVVRWRVQETEAYAGFRDKMLEILKKINCPTHFDRRRYSSCSALDLVGNPDLELNPPGTGFPAPLFWARELRISELDQDHAFTMLETLTLKGT